MASNTIRPGYVSEFSCIGPDCEDSCCIDWSVHVDKQSYLKTMAHPQLKSLAEDSMQPINVKDEDWAIIRFSEQGRCPFLQQDKLCKIHAVAGEEALSETCRSYPRIFRVRGDDGFESLSLSCPEAARLILFGEDAFIFERNETEKPIQPRSVPLWAEKAYDYSIDLLLDEHSDWQQTLLAIGLLVNCADKVTKQQALPELLDDTYTQLSHMAAEGELRQAFQSLPYLPEHQLHIFLSVHSMCCDEHPRRYRPRFGELNDAILAMSDGKEALNMEKINSAWNDIAVPALRANEDLFSRYLLYYIYHLQFPMTADNSPLSAFNFLVLDCFMLRSYLAVMAARHNGLSERDIVLCFQVYHVVRQHKPNFHKSVRSIMEQSALTGVEAVVSLLKTGGS
ncbi:flagellin lysine-N-methylase [uncultured Shewanella sp.]|uniref:flagellin lysine-N-methylase n=1 Tax=uncultured Shewanella sp. TaxID=173975 RepID=UPI002634AD62|nr:flagellin lysine-N-methylase [uncultured Shewanella sp.]